MSTRTLVSLSASVLITAGLFASVPTYRPAPAAIPAVIDGLSVTTLPGITVYPPAANTAASVSGLEASAAVIDAGQPAVSQLLKDAAVQVTNSHLAMPYYAFGSGIGQASKD